MSKKDITKTLSEYNSSVADYPKNSDTIFSSKYSELLGNKNPVTLQIEGIKKERSDRLTENTNVLNNLKTTRSQALSNIKDQQAKAIKTFKELTTATNTNQQNLTNYLYEKQNTNDNVIKTLQDSIYTREKIIHTNNNDAFDKTKLIKTLLILLLLVITLAAISLAYFFHLISQHTTLALAVVVTVIFVYKIIRTYYWRETVNTADNLSTDITATVRQVTGLEPCPVCDNTDWCQTQLKKNPKLCKNPANKNNICCETKNYCKAFNREYKKEHGTDFCEDPNAKENNPDQYYTCCKHNWPQGVAIIDDDTDMQLL